MQRRKRRARQAIEVVLACRGASTVFGVCLSALNTGSQRNFFGRNVVWRGDLLLLIHYWIPMALGWSLATVMRKATGSRFSHAGLILLLAGIGAAYSFDRIADARVRNELSRWLQWALVGTLFVCAGAILFLAASGRMAVAALETAAVLAAASLAYTRLKRLPMAKTALVALCWTWACAALPLTGGGRHWLFLDVTVPLILMLSAACILCDLKDAREDREERIPSLPALFGPRVSCAAATGLAILAAALAAWHHRFGVAAGAALLAAAAQFPGLLAIKPLGAIVVDSILVVPGVLIVMGIV